MVTNLYYLINIDTSFYRHLSSLYFNIKCGISHIKKKRIWNCSNGSPLPFIFKLTNSCFTLHYVNFSKYRYFYIYFVGAERLTLDLSSAQSEIIDFLQDLTTMLQPLVDFCSQCQDKDTKENSLRKKYIIQFILQVFGHPIAYISQHPEKG